MAALEICCFNIASCMIAQANGANRIELCDNPAEGGTTPSLGFIQHARRLLQIDLFPIIRPRGGDFLFDRYDFEIMLEDIRVSKKLGCDGVVIGMLEADGQVDTTRTRRLVKEAYPMEVTFHRAFDRAANPFEALEQIIECGCQRVLTSGQRPLAPEAAELIKQLVMAAADRIIIMPGSGIRAGNIEQLADSTGATEFHSTARSFTATKMKYINPAMEESLEHIICDAAEVRRMADLLAPSR